MMKLFQEMFVTPEQRQLAFLVKQKGGDKVIHDDQAMTELLNKVEAPASVGNERHRPTKKPSLEEILREIRGDPIDAIEKNEKHFNDMFHLQMRQIEESVNRAMNQHEDRIISAVNAGPHDRVKDPVRILARSRGFPDLPFRSSVKSGRTWSVVSTYSVVLYSKDAGVAWECQG